MRLDIVVQAPCGPVQVVVIQCQPILWVAADDIAPDLQSAWGIDKQRLVHLAVKRCANNPLSQFFRQPLSRMGTAVRPHPGSAEHNLDIWVGRKKPYQQIRVLEKCVVRRRAQIRTFLGMPQHILVVQDSVEIQVEHKLSCTPGWSCWVVQQVHSCLQYQAGVKFGVFNLKLLPFGSRAPIADVPCGIGHYARPTHHIVKTVVYMPVKPKVRGAV